ncbi:prepilin peptidase [Dactylosporangium sp. NPDC000244]|uniref:prepilin peptidase n=1 Tax=Dactylosporangium sp. NPDC000244 TaxID=3154365 RepID=UPI00331B87A6
MSAACAGATAAIAFAICLHIGWSISTPGYWLFSVLGVGLTYVDLRRRRLPHLVIGTIWAICAILFTAESVYRHQVGDLAEAVISGLAVSAALMLIALAAPGQLGLGDVHLAGTVAFTLGWLEWKSAAMAIAVALTFQWVWTVITVVRTRHRGVALPLGPALFGAWVIAIIFQ